MTRSNRPGWSISFRHPLRNDARGRIGLKVRRGLGTNNEAEAQKMVDEMNTILSDSAWWNSSKRAEAETRFSKRIVDAFYDDIQAGSTDLEGLRESYIRLPSSEDGYSRILFVGTTGAGKTTLLRQFIGSDHEIDRFPSTAPAKTTISDIEVILSEGRYEAVVTFFSEFLVQSNIEECIVEACLCAREKEDNEKIAEKLLNHKDQRFRLSYILGGFHQSSNDEAEAYLSFDDENTDHDEVETIPQAERANNRMVIESYLSIIKSLSDAVSEKIKSQLSIDASPIGPGDREAVNELIEENFEAYLFQDESFHKLVQDILEDVVDRFKFINAGNLSRRSSAWPEAWSFSCDNRDEFIHEIRWFSSNYWKHFGRLLTPLVEGIRVKGPLCPNHFSEIPKLVFIDGQGLGHTPDSTSSVTTHITEKFDKSNVILLVDNAQQPMQAAPLAVLKAVATSGHHGKLSIAFTHFDHIKGKNLPTVSDKRSHVMASVSQAISKISDEFGTSVAKAIENNIEDKCFMLGGLDKNLDKLPHVAADYMRSQIDRMISFFLKAIIPPDPILTAPIYDPTGIVLAVQQAVNKFHDPWKARLGIVPYEGISKEHWTRIKALNRRFANELDVEYGGLRPVADMTSRCIEAMSRFFDKPVDWTNVPVDDQEEMLAISNIKQKFSDRLRVLIKRRMTTNVLDDWRSAYDYKGRGSTFKRAEAIEYILESAAPIPDSVMTDEGRLFLKEIRDVVVEAIKINKGKITLAEDIEKK